MKTPAKPTHRLVSNMRFLFGCARRDDDRVIVYTVLTAVVGLAVALLELIAVPLVIRLVETAAALPRVLAVVGMLTVGLFACRWLVRFLEGVFSQCRDRFRMKSATCLLRKALTYSYPIAADPQQQKQLDRAAQAVGQHVDAPLPHSWVTLSQLLLNIVGACLYALLLARAGVMLPLVTAVSAGMCAAVTHVANEWGYRHRDEEAACRERPASVSRASRSTALAKDIRVFGLASWLAELHDSGVRALEAFLHRRSKIYLLANLVDVVCTLLRNGIAYTVLIGMALYDGMSVSTFVLYFTAIGGFTLWVRGALSDASALHREVLACGQYREYLQQEEPFCFDGAKPCSGTVHTIELRNVTFTYADADKPVFQHLNLTLRAGERLAIVGRNGVGKTTLARLLCGLYDPDEGAVLLDGVDIRTLDRRAYYTLFAAVFQEFSLPEITVAQQVAQRIDDVDTARVWACLEKAGLDATVRGFAHGLDTTLGRTAREDGVLLSGGQTQRLLLARALYQDRDILLLDEPTAALDPIAEHALYQEYARMTAGKGAVFISHRLASTRFCDRIVYLAGGAVAEEGTHEELLARGGDYAALFAVQSRTYSKGGEPDGNVG